MSEDWMDRMIDSFVEYTGGEMSLSYVSSEYLSGDITKRVFDNYFEKYKRNKGYYDSDGWYEMIMELKEKKIYVKDFNGSNVGMKPNRNDLCIIELGLGWWEKIQFSPDDHIDLNENSNNYITVYRGQPLEHTTKSPNSFIWVSYESFVADEG